MSPDEPSARRTFQTCTVGMQKVIANHVMKVIIGRLQRTVSTLESTKDGVELLHSAWGSELKPEPMPSIYVQEDDGQDALLGLASGSAEAPEVAPQASIPFAVSSFPRAAPGGHRVTGDSAGGG